MWMKPLRLLFVPLITAVTTIGLASNKTPSYTQKPAERPVICIDPGHPSEIGDGYVKQNGTTETHINWVVAQRLRPLLEEAGYHVVMTKQREAEAVKNVRRAAIANANQARLMLRLHCDTGPGSGFRVFYPAQAGKQGKTVGPTLSVRQASGRAAKAVHAALVDGLRDDLKDDGLWSDRFTAVGKKLGALIGSIHSKVPTVLVEMVYLNNPQDAAFIKTAAGQMKMARALAEGVKRSVPLRP
jgi:N-acetylmuramoyl-L-alanine amidase